MVNSGKYMPRSKHPAAVMFLGVVASTGEVSPPIWFPKGFRLNADSYIKALKQKIIPWMKEVAMVHGTVNRLDMSRMDPAAFTFQQDSAPAHRANKTLNFLHDEGISFWGPDQWPPNSPDLNPLDYGIWSMVAQGSCKVRPTSLTSLKKKVGIFWKSMDPSKIRAICQKFRPRLERCVAEKGSYFD